MLTRKQHELLVFIDRRLKETGVSPSFDEMKEALDLKSKSGIHRLITGLEERGFIRRLAHRARALEVIKQPDDVARTAATSAPAPAEPAPSPSPFNVIRPGFRSSPPREAPPSGVVMLPLFGRIAAGTPIEAVRDDTAGIEVPAAMLGQGEHYALEVEGDSMIDAGIHDGDVVVVERCETAENGAIVVALVDNQEATLKRLRRHRDSIALEPANSAYETRIFGPDRVKVQGRLIGLYRRY